MRGKWGKRHFENQTIYTPPDTNMVEYIVASSERGLYVYWSLTNSFRLNGIGKASSISEAFRSIQREHAKLDIVGSY